MSLVPPAAAVLLPELIEGRSSVSILCPVPQHAAGEPRESIKPLELFDLWCFRLFVSGSLEIGCILRPFEVSNDIV